MSSAASKPAGAHPPQRALAGLLGILIAAMMAGLNNRVGALALADIRGTLGYSLDSASWLTTVYSAGELIAMPFAAWFAITLSMRRFEIWMISLCTILALILPFIQNLNLLLLLRFIQGIASGTMIPLLMMAALKFLPIHVRLHGLALYALTATFTPNLSIWLTGYWTDGIFNWRWVYWQIIPLAMIAAGLIAWGLPKDQIQKNRFSQANWTGMVLGVPALGLITIVLDQGIRLDWFNSPLITVSLVGGLTLLVVYLLTEWYHPSPFIKLQILSRRNLGLGFSIFLFLLIVLTSGALLPIRYLASIQDYRPQQMASIGLIIALPQLILGSIVANFLYKKWIDARWVFASGLFLIALSCFLGTHLTSDWNKDQFITIQVLQAFGQPMAIVSMLFLCTSVVQPAEGPYVSGTINTLRAFGSLFGGAVVGQFMISRGHFHTEMLIDHTALNSQIIQTPPEPVQLIGMTNQQSLVLSVADTYQVLGVLALILIPFVLRLAYIPAPDLQQAPTPPSSQ
ncbi:MFS transporter [Acinetobacter dispersus]|uniref:MFS transporter n=1 Tax=Acinetobacter dispersus TaxID=70348 RepID=UPI00300AC8C7